MRYLATNERRTVEVGCILERGVNGACVSMDEKYSNKGELHAVLLRITEIKAALDLCDPNQDDDFMLNLELELTQLDAKLSEAIGA